MSRPVSIRHALAGVLLLALGLTPPAAAQQPAARTDAIFRQWDRENTPGCALGVLRNGTLVHSRGFGMANLDYGIPNSPTMVYYVGSVSKQFTAASIALLAQDGRISLEDDVRTYLPELPDYGTPITIRNLIHHTSGLRDIYVLMDLAGIRMEDVFPDEEALALIARQKQLNFQPGTDYLYSNSGYWLLGQIVERVTGESMREFARKRIFEPLGMSHSHFHDESGHPMSDRVVSYSPDGDGYRIADLQNFDKIGAGGLYTTVEDLVKWDANFYDGRVGGSAFLDLVHTRGVLTNGDTLDYAFGLTIGQYRGLRTVRHGGALMGFRAELLRFPDQRFSVITLCNLGSINPGPLALQVATAWLEEDMSAMPPPAPVVTGTRRSDPAWRPFDETLDAVAGQYHSDEVLATYRIERTTDGITLHRPLRAPTPLRPVEPDTWRAGSLTLRFEHDRAGAVTAFTVQAGRVTDIRFDRTR
jgi:CubicO group peptidase (beta-lactamase class C family)